jgi:putative transposase
MPNHIHGIIIINSLPDKNIMPVGETNFASPTTSPIFYDRTKMELSKLLQQFKRAVTMKQKEIANESDFKWQRSFYDRIIRNEKELYHIRKYIEQNPLKWELEKDIENLPL